MNVVFKEWLPDLPELNNPGLIEASNVLPSDGGYTPFLPLNNAYGTAPAAVVGAFVCNGATKGSSDVYVSAGLKYYKTNDTGPGPYTTLGSLTAGQFGVFTQIENIVFAAAGDAHKLAQNTIGSLSPFAAITAAPYADAIGVVGQFLVAGGLYADAGAGTIEAIKSNYIQWSSIDQPLEWPTPGSDTAIASQSGEQALYEQNGPVFAIHGGDQYGLIFQRGAITRMTYIGGVAVFQFDLIDNTQGLFYKNGSVKVGNLVYFISSLGFCRTDGSQVQRIGEGKVDQHWFNNPGTNTVTCAWDAALGLVRFGNGSYVYHYNPNTGNWTVATQSHTFLITPAPNLGNRQYALGFNSSSPPILGIFAATAGSAVFTTGEFEPSPGGFSRIKGVKPLVADAATMTVAIGTRNDLNSSVSYTSEVTPTTRTGYSDFRSEARYMRARVTITGSFTKAVGIDALVEQSGNT